MAEVVLKEVIGSVIEFPVWWFTRGFLYFASVYVRVLRRVSNTLAVGIWARNVFVPMYGVYDIPGRIISFIVRFAQIIARGVALLLISVPLTALFLLWLGLPVIALIGLLSQLLGSLS